MQNHFKKLNRPNDNFTILNTIDSTLYNLLSEDKLQASQDIFNNYIDYVQKHKNETRNWTTNFKDVQASLDKLVKLGFVKFLSGVKLQKAIGSI